MKNEKNKKRKNQKGFTLVEMIVVIAIIGVLAAMMVPSVLGFVDKAHISNNNSTAAGVGRGVSAILIDLSAKNISVTSGSYKSTKSNGTASITLSKRDTTNLTTTDSFKIEVDSLISKDKFPNNSGIVIKVGSGNRLENVTFYKDGYEDTKGTSSESAVSSIIGVYEP